MLVSFNFSPDEQVVEVKGFSKTVRCFLRLERILFVPPICRKRLSAQERLGVGAYYIGRLSRVRAEYAPMEEEEEHDERRRHGEEEEVSIVEEEERKK